MPDQIPMKPNKRFCVAPMMRYTDRHFRYLTRLISHRAFLYTEMYTAQSILANGAKLLEFNTIEHPVAIQLGGHLPEEMLSAAIMAQTYGYDEVNINVGCPSSRASAGTFGACLMTQPLRLAECVARMVDKLSVPVTVKCRIGVDKHDTYEFFYNFIQLIKGAGCKTFIIHARKALLNGVSPKANRQVPKLQYDYVYRLKRDFPDLTIILNGGLVSPQTAHQHLENGLNGVMLGRAICNQPMLLHDVDHLYYNDTHAVRRSKYAVLQKYIMYMEQQIRSGVPIYPMARHLLNFYKGQQGAKQWRRYFADQLNKNQRSLLELRRFIDKFEWQTAHVVDSVSI